MVCNLGNRRPVSQILAGEVNSQAFKSDMGDELLGKFVSDGDVLEAQVADILQVAVVHAAELAAAVGSDI